MLEQVYDLILEHKENIYKDYFSLLKGRNIVLYGAGGVGYATSNILKDLGCKVSYFIDDDKDKQGTYVNEIEVVSVEDINKDMDFVILLCLLSPMDVYQKFIDQGYKNVYYCPVMMIEKGFYNVSLINNNRDKIFKVYNLLGDDFSKLVFTNILKHRITMDFSYFNNIISQKQYFPSDLFTFSDNECFVDGGAYNGETIIDFIDITNNCFKFIYAFEPDIHNYNTLTKRMEHIDDKHIELFNTGLYSKTGEIGFNSLGNSGSSISKEGKYTISSVQLDDVVREYKPTYIKLDIEGAEEDALYGMKNTITVHRPKLAISIYHKTTDLWELPLLINNLNSSYKTFIRHYTWGLGETVCYAI